MLLNRFKPLSIIFVCIALLSLTVSGLSAQGVQKSNTATYDDGITLFENGLYEKSAEELAHFVAHHPDNALVLSAEFYRARARAQADPRHAQVYYHQFLDQYPRTAFAQKIMIDLAHQEVQDSAYDQAIAHYQRALGQSITKNQSAKIYYWMAQAEEKKKNNRQSRKYYFTLANKYPDTQWAPKALFARGRLFLEEEKYEQASSTFQLILKRYPHNGITRKIGTALGQAYFKQQKYQQAINALKKNLLYLKGDQKNKAILLIAESYNAMNDFKKASAKYLQYINLTKGTPQEREAHYGLGWVYHKQKIYHWAAREFGRAAQGKDTLAQKSLYLKAINQEMGGHYKKAVKSFRDFGKRYSGGVWYEHAYYEWAVTDYKMRNYPGAIEALLKLVRSGKELKMKGKIYTLLGQAYFANKEYTRALQAYNMAEKTQNIDPRVQRKARYQKAWMQYYNQAYEPAQKIFAELYQKHPDTNVGKKALFWNANSLYHLHQYNKAVGLFKDFIAKYPHDKLAGAALYSLGWSYFEMGDYQNALPPFRNFLNNYKAPEIALYPYDTDAKLRMGDSYYALGEYDKAIQTYKKSVHDKPGGDYAVFQIGNCYFRQGQIYQAVRTFRQFMQEYPQSGLKEQAQYNIAYIYLNSGNYQQAVTEFKKAVQKFPNSRWAARSQFNIGDAYYNAGQYKKAIKAYQKVMNDYPRSHYLIQAANGIRYAKQVLKSGKKAAAAKIKEPVDTSSVIQNFVKNNPHNKRAADRLRFNQAEGLVQSGDYLQAITKLRTYTQKSQNPNLLPDAYFLLATAYKKTNRTYDAANTYKTIVQKYENSDESSKALAALGQLLYRQKKYQQSLQYYKELANKGGKHRAEGYVGMGNALIGMEKTKKAKEQYQSALSASTNNDAAKVGLAKVAIQNEDYEQADQSLGPVAKNNTTETGAEAQYLLGITQQKRGHYKQAVQAYETLQSLYQSYNHWMALSMLKSGQCYYKLGKKGQAQKTLKKLIKDYPHSLQTQQALRLLKQNK
jgi:TolA-binding protein